MSVQRVLHVEDAPEFRIVIAAHLRSIENHQFEVASADGEATGLALFEQAGCDLAVLEVGDESAADEGRFSATRAAIEQCERCTANAFRDKSDVVFTSKEIRSLSGGKRTKAEPGLFRREARGG